MRKAQRAPLLAAVPEDHPALAVSGGQEAHLTFIDLRGALEQLPEGQREILVLVVIEGLTYEEAAAVLDIPLGTVRSRVARGRQALKNFLDDGREERVKVVR